MEKLIRLLRDFIEIPSITGDEGAYGECLVRELTQLGLAVERQQLSPGRFNVLARAAEPEVVFCTHLDTVPPFFPSREDGDFVHGRGACDAKGQAVAMLAATEQLLKRGERRFGLLFTVGEETTSDGAAYANQHLTSPWQPQFLIVGEPTGSRFVTAHKGIYKAKLCAHGVAGHSSQQVGPSAIHRLVEAAARVLQLGLGEHPLLGRGSLNIGTITGGVAANVVAERAEAELLVRTVEDPQEIQRRLVASLPAGVELISPYKAYGPVEFFVPHGEDAETVAFGTDTPHLPRWGKPLLFGCGSILDAHTDHEKLEKRALVQCVERHVRLVEDLLKPCGAVP